MNMVRDWSIWPEYELSNQTYIVKAPRYCDPFPAFNDDLRSYSTREPKTPIFNIKTWGTKGYK